MKYFFSVLTVLILGTANAQDSTAISESGTWVIHYNYPVQVWNSDYSAYTFVGVSEYYMYQTAGDTTINSVQYKKLRGYGLSWDGSNYSLDTPGGWHMLAYRNDDSLRAYRIMAGSSSEELWYDFNLDVGDNIPSGTAPAAFSQSEAYNIYSIDSVEYCDSTYKQFHYSNNTSPGLPYRKVVQKVGSLYNLIGDNWNTSVYYELQFFCEGPTTFGDLYNLMGVEDEEPLALNLYPNPAQDIINISGLNQATNYAIYSLDGRIVQNGEVLDQINIVTLEKGNYVIVLEDLTQVLRFLK
jgi:hypothetical protein